MNVRNEKVAGAFYPIDKDVLENDIDKYFYELVDTELAEINCVIVPHAGYIYSGRIAANSYYSLKNHSYERVFIIGPSHQGGTKDVYLSSFDKYKTPLGNIDVDKQITEELSKNLLFGKNEQIEFDEHSIEVQLPFLQKTLNTFKIIPILFANQTLENAKKLFKSIYKYIDKKTLVVISTDLSHYYSSNIAKEKDKLLIDKLICSDSIGLQKLIADGTSEACGIGGLYFAIEFAKKLDLPITPLKYSHSGFINKDFSQVVGYFAGIMGKRYAE